MFRNMEKAHWKISIYSALFKKMENIEFMLTKLKIAMDSSVKKKEKIIFKSIFINLL